MKSAITILILWIVVGNLLGAININSVQKVDSRCLNNGSIVVNATSDKQIFYSIVSGPIVKPPQVSNSFNGLSAGSYKIMVQNLLNEKDSINVVINSNYKLPDFNPILTHPTCFDSSNGSIKGNLLSGTGRAPLQWTLKNLQNNQVISQSSDFFKNLSPNEYSITLTDSCQNITIKSTKLSSLIPPISNLSGSIRRTSCTDIYADFTFNMSAAQLPITIVYTYQNIQETQVITTLPSSNTISKKLSFDPLNSDLNILVTAKCGSHSTINLRREGNSDFRSCYSLFSCDSVKLTLDPELFNSTVDIKTKMIQNQKSFQKNEGREFLLSNLKSEDTINIKNQVCTTIREKKIQIKNFSELYYIFEDRRHSGCELTYTYSLRPTTCNYYLNTKYILIDSSSSHVIDSGSFNGYFLGFYNTPNKFYKLLIIDKCTNNQLATYTFFWRPNYNPSLNSKLTYTVTKVYNNVCLDSTVNVRIDIISGNIGSNVFAKSITGPTVRKNTKNKYGYNLVNGFQTTNNNSNTIILYNLTIGSYTVIIGNNECQNETITFNIESKDVSNNYYTIEAKKGCWGNNKLEITLSSKHPTDALLSKKEVHGWFSVYSIDKMKFIDNYDLNYFSYKSYWNNRFEYKAIVDYLEPGSYKIAINYRNSVNQYNPEYTIQCNEIVDTAIIKPYTRPSIKLIQKIKCNENNYVVFDPDSAHGVFPYNYEVINSSTYFPPQNENYVLINNTGDYQVKIRDLCGNTNTMDFSLDTLNFVPIYESKKSCISKNVILKYQSSPFFTYRWKKPNGTVFYGDSLSIDSVELEDIGTYYIARFVNFYGCKDSFLNIYTLNKNKYIIKYDTIYKGDSLLFGNAYLKNQGVYRDTIFIDPCDSLSTLHLHIIDTNTIDSTFFNIQRCKGDTFYFLDTFYTKSGVYYHNNISKWRKRTVIVVNLSIDYYLRNRTKKEICDGENYKGFTLPGIYRDTLPSSQKCDSIAELELIVHPIFRYTKDTIVCDGEGVWFEGDYYTKTGTYQKNYKSQHSCDSIYILKLKIWDKPYNRNDSFYACKKFIYKNKTYYKTTNLLDTIPNILGCDSVYLFVHLNIGSDPTRFFDSINYCDTIRVNGRLYSENFYFRDTLYYSSGLRCDSMYRLFKYNFRKSSQLKLDIYPNTTELYQGERIRLTLTPAKHYRWSTGDTSQRLEFEAKQDTWFSAIAWNNPQCKDTVSVHFTVLSPGILDIPKAFAPSGMIENRVFKPNFHGMVDIINFSIYNRWGEKIYETHSKDNIGWDGTYKGEDVLAGVFSYILEYKINRNRYFKSGEVLLVR